MDIGKINNHVLAFIEQCRLSPFDYRFASTPSGTETLYASVLACMLLHYLNVLQDFSSEQQNEWANYIKSWQDPATGYFIGPEIVQAELTSRKHSYEHVSQHLTAHVLPALNLLGVTPEYPLRFAQDYLDLKILEAWLNKRDWRDAWLEGNNLLFVGQFLIFLRDVEKKPSAQASLNLLFEWLDCQIDSDTGLWGTNGYCSPPEALYGGYHQLLLYYYENRVVRFPEHLIDSVLSLQHIDGGFHPDGGGGACEDVDAIDVLVNMYKYTDYRRPEIRIALRKAIAHILRMQMPDGGFVYRLNQPFVHMGIQRTLTLPNQSNMFPTWFRIHTLALLSEILTDEANIKWDWQFNDTCSMGWHRSWSKAEHPIKAGDRYREELVKFDRSVKRSSQATKERINRYRKAVLKRAAKLTKPE